MEMSEWEGVRVYPEEWARGGHRQARIVIASDGLAWEACFGSMGRDLVSFLAGTGAHYVASKMEPVRDEIDFEEINRRLGTDDVDITNCYEHENDLRRVFGDDWMMDLPKMHTLRFTSALRAAEKVIQWAKSQRREAA